MPKIILALAALFAAALFPAFAQAPQQTPVRIRGTVESLQGQSLTVRSRDGATLTIALAPKFAVSAVVKRQLADLKAEDFVGITSLTGSDGRQQAVEVHVLPAGLRGVVRQGQFPWDLMPKALMTNAIVARVAAAPEGGMLHVTFAGGAADIGVGPRTEVVATVPGDASLLKPGAAVFLVALKGPDGSLKAARVTAEKDGIKPPM